jgi:hypothetical protein
MSKAFFLKSVEVENFKAVQKSGLVELTPLTVFIGNNGSGKSSLIEAMETYREILLHGLDAALDRWHGVEHLRNKHAAHPGKPTRKGREALATLMLFHFQGRWKRGSLNVDMAVAMEEGGNAIRIAREFIQVPPHRVITRQEEGVLPQSNLEERPVRVSITPTGGSP